MLFIVNVWNSDTKIHCDLKFYVLHLVNIFNIAAIAQLTMLYTALFHAISRYISCVLVDACRASQVLVFSLQPVTAHVNGDWCHLLQYTAYRIYRYFSIPLPISEFLSIFATCAVSNGLDVKYLDFTLTSYSFSRSMFHVYFFLATCQ